MENMEGLDPNSTHNIAKGKRTKRMRFLSSTATIATTTTTIITTSSCSSANSGGSSTTTYESEEEDMANCLILLAQGGESHHHHDKQEDCEGNKTEKGNSNTNTATVANTTKVGFYIYECKTCNRTFPSFQALGGHRASHKKPKLVAEEKKLPPPTPPSQLAHMIITNYDRFEEANVKIGPSISLQLGHANNNNNKAKIHECSICGSEFTSGQALGGHMRRHRTSTNNTNNTVDTSCNMVTTQSRNILQLDLNLPAPPEDDVLEAKFQFTTTQVLGAPALIDCHY